MSLAFHRNLNNINFGIVLVDLKKFSQKLVLNY